MNRFASTRSAEPPIHPGSGFAQWSVGSIDDDGMRYGLTIHALIARTMAIAPAMVTTQSTATRHGRGIPCVKRSSGLCERCGCGDEGGVLGPPATSVDRPAS